MNPFEIFGKKTREAAVEKDRWINDRKALEIYSGMRVVVEDRRGQALFIARLQDPQDGKAELYQYSDTEILQDISSAACSKQDAGSIPVEIRGYNDRKRTAVFMEGMITPKQKHVWQVERLQVIKIENERSSSRLEMDIDAVITVPGETDTRETACKLLNISIGGVGVRSEHRYYKGERFLLKARLMENGSISTMYCEVLRVIEKNRNQFEYGCQFLVLPQAVEEEITQELLEAE